MEEVQMNGHVNGEHLNGKHSNGDTMNGDRREESEGESIGTEGSDVDSYHHQSAREGSPDQLCGDEDPDARHPDPQHATYADHHATEHYSVTTRTHAAQDSQRDSGGSWQGETAAHSAQSLREDRKRYDSASSQEEHKRYDSASSQEERKRYDSASSQEEAPLDWHTHQLATSPPASLRIEDTLADFQPSRRYVKPQDKPSSKGPGIMIMATDESAHTLSEDIESDPPVEHVKPSQPFGSLVSKYTTEGASGDMMCQQCGKRVYEMEKMIANNAIYHKMCFKCHHCKRILSLGNFASLDKQLYCKPHFIEIFKTRGNYDDSFDLDRKSTKSDLKSDDMEADKATEEHNLQSSHEIDPKDIARGKPGPVWSEWGPIHEAIVGKQTDLGADHGRKIIIPVFLLDYHKNRQICEK